MKDKVFLLLCCFFLTGCQSQVKQSVSAETENSVQSQQEEPAPTSSEDQPIVSEAESVSDSASYSEVSESYEVGIAEVSSAVDNSEEQTFSGEVSQETNEESGMTETEVTDSEETNSSVTPTLEVFQEIPTSPSETEVEENYQFSIAKNRTTEEFIQTIGKDAQQIAWDEGLYASVMIAQAILETGSGNSQLARPPHHNLFGIKGSYQGKQVNFNTQEDKGNGELYTINSGFRQYPSYKESLEDYAALLKNGLSGNPSFYQATWKTNAATYQEAAKALTGKYATDTSYDKKLNALIETYELTDYDQEPNKDETPVSTEQQVESREKAPETSRSSESTEETTQEQQPIVSKTKQQAVIIPPVTQRPAKQLYGNRPTQ